MYLALPAVRVGMQILNLNKEVIAYQWMPSHQEHLAEAVQADVSQMRLHTHQKRTGHQVQALPGQTVKMGKKELQKTMTGELTIQCPVEKVKVRRPLLMARLILQQVAVRLMHFTAAVMSMNQKQRAAGLAQEQDMLVQMVVMQRKKAQAVVAPLAHLPPTLGQVQAQTAA